MQVSLIIICLNGEDFPCIQVHYQGRAFACLVRCFWLQFLDRISAYVYFCKWKAQSMYQYLFGVLGALTRWKPHGFFWYSLNPSDWLHFLFFCFSSPSGSSPSEFCQSVYSCVSQVAHELSFCLRLLYCTKSNNKIDYSIESYGSSGNSRCCFVAARAHAVVTNCKTVLDLYKMNYNWLYDILGLEYHFYFKLS